MGLDVRLPIGMLFSVLGILLVLFGAFSNPALYQRSLGVNVNLVWGAVLLAFGAVMLVLGWRGMATVPKTSASAHAKAQREEATGAR